MALDDLDAIDRELLALLQRDTRRSVASLAKAVHRSRTAVQSRLERLERDDYIAGYSLLPGARMSAPRVEAMVSIVFSERPCGPVLGRFADWPELLCVWSLAGDTDALAHVAVARADDLSELLDRLSAVDGVASAVSSVVLRTSADARR